MVDPHVPRSSPHPRPSHGVADAQSSTDNPPKPKVNKLRHASARASASPLCQNNQLKTYADALGCNGRQKTPEHPLVPGPQTMRQQRFIAALIKKAAHQRSSFLMHQSGCCLGSHRDSWCRSPSVRCRQLQVTAQRGRHEALSNPKHWSDKTYVPNAVHCSYNQCWHIAHQWRSTTTWHMLQICDIMMHCTSCTERRKLSLKYSLIFFRTSAAIVNKACLSACVWRSP